MGKCSGPLETRVLGEQERELYAEIFSAIVADDALASDITTRVRALVRREELPQQPVDLNEICRTSARVLQYDARARHAQITLTLDPHLPAVTGDPIQFQQVVLNLMLNALDASAGLTANVQQHLFESFLTTKTQGLGLGLPIVQSIGGRHDGRVRAENSEQGGAIFRVVVPVRRSPRTGAAEGATELGAATERGHLAHGRLRKPFEVDALLALVKPLL
jgi:signal transduction histidine kinase